MYGGVGSVFGESYHTSHLPGATYYTWKYVRINIHTPGVVETLRCNKRYCIVNLLYKRLKLCLTVGLQTYLIKGPFSSSDEVEEAF